MKNLVTRNIIIRPDEIVTSSVIGFSKQLAKQFPTDFVLDGKSFYPHISIYQATYPENNLNRMEKRVAELAKRITPFDVDLVEFTSMLEFIFLDAVKNDNLVSLHELVVKETNPFREGNIIPAELPRLSDPNTPEYIKYSIRTYGAALVMDAFLPHITITHCTKLSDVELAKQKLQMRKFHFRANSLWMADIGPFGTVNNLILEFPFG